jgi:hypothetical protein
VGSQTERVRRITYAEKSPGTFAGAFLQQST